MTDKHNLNRFISAQSNSYETALNEIINGKKDSHWMWYIFPQLKGIGRSETAIKYAIQDRQEAIDYFNHPVLVQRLLEITQAFLKINNGTAKDILGSPDYLKLKSCMTLFNEVQKEEKIFEEVINKYYNGAVCPATLEKLN